MYWSRPKRSAGTIVIPSCTRTIAKTAWRGGTFESKTAKHACTRFSQVKCCSDHGVCPGLSALLLSAAPVGVFENVIHVMSSPPSRQDCANLTLARIRLGCVHVTLQVQSKLHDGATDRLSEDVCVNNTKIRLSPNSGTELHKLELLHDVPFEFLNYANCTSCINN